MSYIFKFEKTFLIILSLLYYTQSCPGNSCNECSDNNCQLCPTNKNYCSSAKDGFFTNNGTVLKCSEHCKTCSDKNSCTKCESNFTIYEGECVYYGEKCKNKFTHCKYCTEDKCLECENIYKINDKGQCVPDPGFLALFICVTLSVVLSSAICAIYKTYNNKKKLDLNLEQNRIRFNNQNTNIVQIIIRNDDVCDPETNRNLNEKILKDEFEKQNLKRELTDEVCKFCKKNIARYICECGCIVCDEHSKLKEDKENNKVCLVCEKIIKTIKPKFNCGICMDDVLYVAHFKCNCALDVCCKCYIRCRLENNKCPACRKFI